MKPGEKIVMLLGIALVVFGLYIVSICFMPATDPPPPSERILLVFCVGALAILVGVWLVGFSSRKSGFFCSHTGKSAAPKKHRFTGWIIIAFCALLGTYLFGYESLASRSEGNRVLICRFDGIVVARMYLPLCWLECKVRGVIVSLRYLDKPGGSEIIDQVFKP